MQVTAQELLQMYQALKKEHTNILQKNKDMESKIKEQQEYITVLEQEVINLQIKEENLLLKNQIKELKDKNDLHLERSDAIVDICGPEKIGDLTDYEYSCDGKRMCFINYKTNNRIYADDELFHVLKNRMITNIDF